MLVFLLVSTSITLTVFLYEERLSMKTHSTHLAICLMPVPHLKSNAQLAPA